MRARHRRLLSVRSLFRPRPFGGRADWLRPAAADARLRAPVPAYLYVESCSRLQQQSVLINGVLLAAGMKPLPASHRTTLPAGRFPSFGDRLPVTFDRTDPHRMVVHWTTENYSQPRRRSPR